jgi:hypothetical protein
MKKIILNDSTSGMYSFICKNTDNNNSSLAFSKVHASTQGQKPFFRTSPCHAKKNAEIYVDFKDYNLTF